jgi:DTW domain-containing protein YfiP
MARSVVLAGTERCDRCRLPPRWCICDGIPPIACPLQVDLLMHPREQWRPTSTGKLIERAVPGSRVHPYTRGVPPDRAALLMPGRELWILHPRGEPIESLTTAVPSPDPSKIQLLLLDGSWRESGDMLRHVETWGRTVRLSLSGPSRYALREQQGENRHSTVEALIAVLRELGLEGPAGGLRLHFELHVYVTLRARGKKAQAEAYLRKSPLGDAIPDLLARLNERRPNPSPPRGTDPEPPATH